MDETTQQSILHDKSVRYIVAINLEWKISGARLWEGWSDGSVERLRKRDHNEEKFRLKALIERLFFWVSHFPVQN
jgi:hypothetical protein